MIVVDCLATASTAAYDGAGGMFGINPLPSGLNNFGGADVTGKSLTVTVGSAGAKPSLLPNPLLERVAPLTSTLDGGPCKPGGLLGSSSEVAILISI